MQRTRRVRMHDHEIPWIDPVAQPSRPERLRNVLCVIHAPAWGGPHTICEQLGPVCRELGWNWIMTIPPGSDGSADRLRRAGLEVIEVPLRRMRRTRDPRVHADYLVNVPRDVIRLARLIERYDCAVVQIFGLLHYQAAFAAKLRRRALIWQLHSDLAPAFMRRSFSPLVRTLADVVMTSGTGLIQAHPGIERLGDRLIPFLPPVDLNRFRPDDRLRSDVRRRLGMPEDAILIGTVGNQGMQKNHGMLVRVASRLSAASSRAHIIIVGRRLTSQVTWYADNVLAEMAALPPDVRHRVRVVEPEWPIADYMGAFDIFVLSSIAEGVPLVVAEAMATGLPVVATDVGSLRDSVFDGETGYLVATNDDAAMADRLLGLMHSPARRRAMSIAALQRAQEIFDIRHCAAAHADACLTALAWRTAGLADRRLRRRERRSPEGRPAS